MKYIILLTLIANVCAAQGKLKCDSGYTYLPNIINSKGKVVGDTCLPKATFNKILHWLNIDTTLVDEHTFYVYERSGWDSIVWATSTVKDGIASLQQLERWADASNAARDEMTIYVPCVYLYCDTSRIDNMIVYKDGKKTIDGVFDYVCYWDRGFVVYRPDRMEYFDEKKKPLPKNIFVFVSRELK